MGVYVCLCLCVCQRKKKMMRERRCVGFADGEEREKKGVKCEINKILVCKAKVNRA